ncbi:DUF1439 domain-containing protein [Pseudoalteromonas ruthenica]|uniref:DUF1439 domain-containing protein n=1 Tax=Pseudoalteromonas ruthenica TaxID=151081 RepID=UPI001244A7D5|nr:DUF1439 domain-containing protein [Pseudoalteromonas ruthenica]
MKRFLIVAVWLLSLAGCASHAPVSVYSLSATQLEQNLQSNSERLQGEVELMGMPMRMQVNDVGVDIGPKQHPDSVQLSVDNTVFVQALALKVPVRVRLSIAAKPVFNNDDDAVYLQDFTIINADVDAMGYRGKLAPLSQQVQDIVTQALRQYPVYTLNSQDPKQALLSRFDLALAVKPGEITLTSGL